MKKKIKLCAMCGQKIYYGYNEFCQDCEDSWIFDQGLKQLNRQD